MTEARQKIFKTMGEGACYALSIIRIAEKILGHYVDALQAFLIGNGLSVVVGGVQRHAVDPLDCTVWGAGEFLSMLTGETWVRVWAAKDYQRDPGEYEVECWARKFTGGSATHFIETTDPADRYDPLGDCIERWLNLSPPGYLDSKRIFRRANTGKLAA